MRTHTGKTITGKKLDEARKHVAEWKRENTRAIRKEDAYAAHISETMKDSYLEKGLSYADEIEDGMHDGNFTIWQRMNTFITGDCIAFLPKS